MKRPPIRHPDWCALYRCTAKRQVPGAEHRSDPVTWKTPYGFYVVTLVQTVNGRVSVELRADVVLDAGDPRPRAQQLAVGVDLAVRDVLTRTLTERSGAKALPSANQREGIRGHVPVAQT